MRKAKRGQNGFSLLEMLVVVGIMMTLLAFAIIQSFGSMESYRANAAMDMVISQLRVARQLAISQRRNVRITFSTASSPQTITYTVMPDPGDTVTPTPVTVPIPNIVKFSGFTGEPDTPMLFGTCGGNFGICVAGVSGGPPGMYFNAVGQFTDNTYVNTLNGTVFMVIPNMPATARAVTIMGSTGRVRPYNYIGSSTWNQ